MYIDLIWFNDRLLRINYYIYAGMNVYEDVCWIFY